MKRLADNPPKRSPGQAYTFHFFMHDHGPCSLEGLPEYEFNAQDDATWSSPIISVNGERWSTSASQPCHNPYRDIVVPTPNFMLPSFEGNILARTSTQGAESTRPTLAFMVVGAEYPIRTALERFHGSDYDGDKEIHLHFRPRLDHATTYMNRLLKSKFCIQADGNAPWSPRLVEYIAAGCVPVLVR